MIDKQTGPAQRARAWKRRHSWRIDEHGFSKKRLQRQHSLENFVGAHTAARNSLSPPNANYVERLRTAYPLIQIALNGRCSEKVARLIHRLTALVIEIGGEIR